MVHETTAEPTSPRARRRQRTMEQIVAAALRLLTEEGFEALTVQRLAKELGYAAGALYRYFPSKDAVVVAVQRRVLEGIRDDVRATLRAAAEDEPTTRILATAGVYESLARRRPAQLQLLSLSLGDPRELLAADAARELFGPLAELQAEVTGLFREAEAAGALSSGDPERRAIVLWASLQGVMQLHKLARFELEALAPDALSTEALHALLLGWGADPDSVRRAHERAADLLHRTLTDRDDEDQQGAS